MSAARRVSGAKVASFSLPAALDDEIRALTKEMGYTNRSELIRDALRRFMKEKEAIDGLEGTVEGVVIALYDHSAEGLVSEIRHRNMGIIRSYMHTDFDHPARKCCDVLFVSGEAGGVRGLVFDIRSVKNVGEVRLFVA